ncbi:MAG: high-affinity branched-chain amino acid ABC transporter permease LivM [Alphaproteobacteria bacterium]|jgi:branched-chain amino acid transport system permease protein
MAESPRSSTTSLATALREAALAALVAALLSVPLLGFRLVDSAQGLSLDYRFLWVVYAAFGVFSARLILNLTGSSIVGSVQKGFSGITIVKRFTGDWERIVGWVLIGLAFLLPLLGDRNLADRATLVLIYVMLGTGLSIVVGLAGLLDLGYVAFYAVGAYCYAILALTFGLSFWICLPLAGLFAGLFGILLGFPVLRLRGDYLAIVTLGFGEIVRILLINWQDLTGGPDGIIGIPRPTLFGLEFRMGDDAGSFAGFFGIPFSPAHRIFFLYYLALALVLFTVFFVQRIRRLPIGRAWEALREDEIACRSLGLNPTTIKLSAFALGASFAGFAGSFFATRQGFISPESFTFIESAIILAIVVLGGMGSVIGIVFAAILLVGLPEWFRELEQFRMLAFGMVMVLVVVWRPHGLLSKRSPSVLLNQQATK